MKGKDKCEFLKGIRKRMAETNGIPYNPRECTYEGDCTGTCPFCEKEAEELLAELKKKESDGFDIKPDDVGILAIELGINECHESNEGDDDDPVLTAAEGSLIEQGQKRAEKKVELKGSLVNSDQDIQDLELPPIPSIDPFKGSNNPLMSAKALSEMRRQLEDPKEPLMGDIRDPYVELTEEEKAVRIQLEESLHVEDEMGIIRPNKIESILPQIKGLKTQGLIDEEDS